MAELERRVEALERENRRWKRFVFAAVLAGCVGPLLMGQAKEHDKGTEEVVRARRFEAVDAEGKLRATLAVAADGAPALRLNGPDGKTRAELRVTENGWAALVLRDDDGKPRAVVNVNAGLPAVVLRDHDGKAVWDAP